MCTSTRQGKGGMRNKYLIVMKYHPNIMKYHPPEHHEIPPLFNSRSTSWVRNAKGDHLPADKFLKSGVAPCTIARVRGAFGALG